MNIFLVMHFIVAVSFITMIFCSICMVLTNNPIYGLKFLVIIFLNFGFILLFYGITYLGLLFIMVYVGAVTILFTYAVMMLNIKIPTIKNFNYIYIGVLLTFFASLLIFNIFEQVIVINVSYGTVDIHYDIDNILTNILLIYTGVAIYNNYIITLFIIGILLLDVTIASIYITFIHTGIKGRKQLNQNDVTNTLSFLFRVLNNDNSFTNNKNKKKRKYVFKKSKKFNNKKRK